MNGLFERLEETAAALAARTGREAHDVVVVLGSGLGDYPSTLDGRVSVPYDELPGFVAPGAVGHSGTAHSVEMGGNRILFLAGRPHAYEGHVMDVVTFPVRAAITAGCKTVVLTNAAGGCGKGIGAGDLVLISDHINMSGMSPLIGPNDERLGPRFPDMSTVYTPRVRARPPAPQPTGWTCN